MSILHLLETLDEAGKEQLSRELQRRGYGGRAPVERQHLMLMLGQKEESCDVQVNTFDKSFYLAGLLEGSEGLDSDLILLEAERHGWVGTGVSLSLDRETETLLLSFLFCREVVGERSRNPFFDFLSEKITVLTADGD